ncbi:MAG: hypothetical protein JW702_09665 [Clostridiales bacterium]|nr:hypothetical protein [Clostridiales bacterium]
MITVLTSAGFLIGLYFKRIKGILKSHTATFALLSFAMGFGILSYTSNLRWMSLSMIFVGYAAGTINPIIFYITSMYSKKEDVTFSLALISGAMFLARFLSPFANSGLEILFNMNTSRMPFYSSTVLSVISLIVYLLLRKRVYID